MIVTEGIRDIFTAPADAVVITVNCEGVMGKGIALGAKRKFPLVYKKYRALCKSGGLKPGDVVSYSDYPQMVVLVATKNYWRGDSKLDWVITILETLSKKRERLEGRSIAVPPLGCGNGGLTYDPVVRDLLYEYLSPLKNHVHICL